MPRESTKSGTNGTSRRAVLEWVCSMSGTEYESLAEVGDGLCGLQMLNSLLPGQIRMERIYFEPKTDYERRENLLFLKKTFLEHNVNIHVDVEKMHGRNVSFNYTFHKKLMLFYNSNASPENRLRLNPHHVREEAQAKAKQMKMLEQDKRKRKEKVQAQMNAIAASPYKLPPKTPRTPSNRRTSVQRVELQFSSNRLQAQLNRTKEELEDVKAQYADAYNMIEQVKEMFERFEDHVEHVAKRELTDEEKMLASGVKNLFGWVDGDNYRENDEHAEDNAETGEEVGGTETDFEEADSQVTPNKVE